MGEGLPLANAVANANSYGARPRVRHETSRAHNDNLYANVI